MRLLIAGILTLVIYLLTCAWGSEGRAVPQVKERGISAYNTQNTHIFIHSFYYYLFPFHDNIQPPYIPDNEKHQIDIQRL